MSRAMLVFNITHRKSGKVIEGMNEEVLPPKTKTVRVETVVDSADEVRAALATMINVVGMDNSSIAAEVKYIFNDIEDGLVNTVVNRGYVYDDFFTNGTFGATVERKRRRGELIDPNSYTFAKTSDSLYAEVTVVIPRHYDEFGQYDNNVL